MGLWKNNWKDRQAIRDRLFSDEGNRVNEQLNITPVLLCYWTQEYLEVYLIPASPTELAILSRVNGIDCNGTGWEKEKDVFDYIEKMIQPTQDGSWKDRYLVDTHDEDGQPLRPITLPPGTVLIVTGFIL